HRPPGPHPDCGGCAPDLSSLPNRLTGRADAALRRAPVRASRAVVPQSASRRAPLRRKRASRRARTPFEALLAARSTLARALVRPTKASRPGGGYRGAPMPRPRSDSSAPALAAPPSARDNPFTRSIPGVIGLAFLSVMLIACLGTLPWTL